jgi:hypothetical protein
MEHQLRKYELYSGYRHDGTSMCHHEGRSAAVNFTEAAKESRLAFEVGAIVLVRNIDTDTFAVFEVGAPVEPVLRRL